MAAQFLDLYKYARDRQTRVVDYMDRTSNQVSWAPILRRDLIEYEERQLFSMLELLGQVFILDEGEDCKI